MNRLEEIIATLNDISTDYSTDETRLDVVAAIKLLRAGAEMREAVVISDRKDGEWGYVQNELLSSAEAWDAALEEGEGK